MTNPVYKFLPAPSLTSYGALRQSPPGRISPPPGGAISFGGLDMRRPNIPVRWRQEIWQSRCAACGRWGVVIDHIVPVRQGGTNDRENLQPLCKRCNAIKGGRLMTNDESANRLVQLKILPVPGGEA